MLQTLYCMYMQYSKMIKLFLLIMVVPVVRFAWCTKCPLKLKLGYMRRSCPSDICLRLAATKKLLRLDMEIVAVCCGYDCWTLVSVLSAVYQIMLHSVGRVALIAAWGDTAPKPAQVGEYSAVVCA